MKTKISLAIFLCVASTSFAQFRNSTGTAFPYTNRLNQSDVMVIGRPGVSNYNVAGSNVLAVAVQADANNTIRTNVQDLLTQFPYPLTNALDGSEDYSIGYGRTPNLNLALTYSNNVRLLFLGDSRGEDVIRAVKNVFDKYSTFPVAPAAWINYPDWWSRRGSFNGTAQTQTNVPALWWTDFPYVPTGSADYWAGGGSQSLYATNVNLLSFYYFGGSTNCILTVATETPAGSFADIVSVNTASFAPYLFVTNKQLALGTYRIRITASGTGNGYYLCPSLINSNGNSAAIFPVAAGGISLSGFLGMGTNTIATLLSNIAPDHIFYSQTKTVSSFADFPSFKYLADTYATNADVTLVAVSASTNVTTAADTNQGSWYQMQVQRAYARQYGWSFVDMVSPSIASLRNMNRGLSASDGIHRSVAGQMVDGAIFLDKFGLQQKLFGTGKFTIKFGAPFVPLTNGTAYGIFTVHLPNDRRLVVSNAGSADATIWMGYANGTALGNGNFILQGDQNGVNTFNADGSLWLRRQNTPQFTINGSGGIIIGDVFGDQTDPGYGNARFNLKLASKGTFFASNTIAMSTNYVVGNWTPISGFISLVTSNNSGYSTALNKTNLIIAP